VKRRRTQSILYHLVGVLLSLSLPFSAMPVGVDAAATQSAAGYWHTQGNQIVDAQGQPVILTGVNWFGLETPQYAPHGLWARNWEDLLDQIRALGFNSVRLPYSNQLFDSSSLPNSINYDLNPDLQGLNGLQIMDKIVEGAGERGLKVILDRHRPDSGAQSDLWYTDLYGEERWIADWLMLAQRYAGDDTVVGVDLHNEPHGRATWGSGDPATDWRLAAERAGNAILRENPNLLILVQGVERVGDDWYWWGGNLAGVREHPVRLSQPDQLVYSPHTYGPGVYPQAWFSAPDFPDNLPGIWREHWAYVQQEDIAPVVVGEFGGRSVGDDPEGIWQRTLVAYLRDNQLSYFYWSLNPNSGDTGGVLLDDWQTVNAGKVALLSSYQSPVGGSLDTPPGATAEAVLPPALSTLEIAPPTARPGTGPVTPTLRPVLATATSNVPAETSVALSPSPPPFSQPEGESLTWTLLAYMGMSGLVGAALGFGLAEWRGRRRKGTAHD
jgi:endoglucanase